MLAPCAACYNRLTSARAALEADPALAAEIAAVIEMPVTGQVKVVNVLEVLDRFKDVIQEKTVAPLRPQGGLLLRLPPGAAAQGGGLRPARGSPVHGPPDGRRRRRAGLDWNFKTECCGAAFSVTRTDLVARHVRAGSWPTRPARGAEAIVVACPMCQSNLDMRRPEINARPGRRTTRCRSCSSPRPSGLALGLAPKALGLQRHMVPALPCNPRTTV